jgi:hypothetical protein
MVSCYKHETFLLFLSTDLVEITENLRLSKSASPFCMQVLNGSLSAERRPAAVVPKPLTDLHPLRARIVEAAGVNFLAICRTLIGPRFLLERGPGADEH